LKANDLKEIEVSMPLNPDDAVTQIEFDHLKYLE